MAASAPAPLVDRRVRVEAFVLRHGGKHSNLTAPGYVDALLENHPGEEAMRHLVRDYGTPACSAHTAALTIGTRTEPP